MQHIVSILYLGILGLLPGSSVASPVRRAGGPAAIPIPSNCTVTDPLPGDTCKIGNVHGWKVSDSFILSYSLYSAYYDSSLSLQDTWTQCSEQCYGYGTPGTCKSVLLAYNVTIPPGQGHAPAGQLSPTACLMYSKYVSTADFVLATEGEFVNETAGNIHC